MHGDVTTRLRELHHTIETGARHKEGVLTQVALNLEPWAATVRREKAIFHTLNKLSMDASRRVLVAEAWVPVGAKPRVAEALRRAAAEAGGAAGVSSVLQPLVTGDAPPTYFRTDAFTGGE